MIEIQLNKKSIARNSTNITLTDKKSISVFPKITSAKFKVKSKKIFFNDLYILLSSGIDLINALNIITNNFKEKDRKVVHKIAYDLQSGASFNGALMNSGAFTPYEFFSIKIGEETGSLVKVLKELARYETERIEQRRKVVSAFSYPIIVMITAILALTFMLKFIVPMFHEIFLRFDKELPYLTRIIVKISDNFSTVLLVIILLSITGYFINHYFKENDKYLLWKSNLILKTPLFGILIKKVLLARFALAMELLLSAKTPIVDCVNLAKSMVSFYLLKISLEKIERDLLNGYSLHISMEQCKFFDLRMIELVKVAEEVNKLEEIFKEIKNQLNSEIEYQTGIISSALEPLLMIFIGLFVGVILVAMYLPIFKISNTFF